MIVMPARVLGREPGARGGEVVLRARAEADREVYELIVNGVFAIDSVDSSAERRLATETLARVSGEGLRVLVAGLGLGYTVASVLADRRVGAVDVVELEPALVEWARQRLVPVAADVLADERVTVSVGDVRDVLPDSPPAVLDVMLLDVDNGPSFLLHEANAHVYDTDFLRSCLSLLRPGGALAIWCSDRTPWLQERLRRLRAKCEELLVPVERDGRVLQYALYLAVTRTGFGGVAQGGD